MKKQGNPKRFRHGAAPNRPVREIMRTGRAVRMSVSGTRYYQDSNGTLINRTER